MPCPSCGSSQIQLKPVIHASGTSQIDVTTVAGVPPHQWRSVGMQQTHLAELCAPPSPPSPLPPIIALGVGGYVIYGGWTGYSTVQWKGVLIGVGIMAAGLLLAKGWYRNAIAYSDAKRDWQQTALCLSCGHCYLCG
jgi:hypothetical protein